MSARCAGRLLCSAALWCRPPPAGRERNLLPRGIQVQCCINRYSESREGHGGGGQPEAPRYSSPLGLRTWRRRSLSPLDRVSRLIPPECISQEIRDLQSPEQVSSAEPPSSSQDPSEQLSSSSQDPSEQLSSSHHESGSPEQHCSPEPFPSAELGGHPESSPPRDLAPSQGVPFQPGDLLMAEFKRRHYSMFRKMFVLKNSGKLVSNWGAINNKDLVGNLPGVRVQTSTGHELLLKRPSLDEYVMYMKRGPTISYPKDVASMLMMMDVNPGDVILEAGSGSGALSLFLSRAVGPDGCVHSVEVRPDHHHIAQRNFLQWQKSWQIRSGRSWPDNVNFINRDVVDAMSDLQSVGFDAVALDMLNPQVALPAIIGNLKQGAVCAAYITNITQVIDLLEGIRTCELPLLCEKVIQVSITDWLVAPSLRKDGRVSKRVEPQWNGSSETQTQEPADDGGGDDDESHTDDDFVTGRQPFGQVPYIARPMPWQTGHTAFLVQLRKIKAAKPTEPEDSS